MKNPIALRQTATLTIEPCAEVRFAPQAGITVSITSDVETPTLRARGAADRPIALVADGAEPWSGLTILGRGTVDLAHVTLEGAGAIHANNARGASIRALGGANAPLAEMLRVDHVTVRGSRGLGIEMTSNAGFTRDSTDLTITASGNDDQPFPISVDTAGWGTVPSGVYTGNRKDVIELRAATPITTSESVKHRGVPYRLAAFPDGRLTIEGDARPVLTLEAGVVLQMEPKTHVEVGTGALGSGAAKGGLRTLGTATRPVVITSASDAPAPGDWTGIFFHGDTAHPDDEMAFTTIEYAGGDCLCSGQDCYSPGLPQNAALLFLPAEPDEAFFHDGILRHIAGHGVLRAWTGADVSFVATNTFEDVAECKETVPRDGTTNQCPDPLPACK